MNIPEEIVEALVEHYGADAVRSALDNMQARYKRETPAESNGAAQKRVVCPVCGGEGSTPGRYKQLRMMCPSCNGTGEILRDIADIEREEAWEAMQQENKADAEEPERNNLRPLRYWDRISEMNERQEAKGLFKYGQPLEENTDMPNDQRIEHAQEEAIDLLKYLEHLKQTVVDGITANDYQRAAMRTAWAKTEDELSYLVKSLLDSGAVTQHQLLLLNGVLGLSGETGEVADHVKKAVFHGHDLDVDHLAEELGDVAWYLAVTAHAIGYDLGDIFQRNIDKLAKRYPDGFSKERSLHREA